MPREARSAAQDFQRLKALLVGAEADELALLARRIDHLDNYVGEAQRLEVATADIIAQSLRRAEIARHRELANAIAPLIVSVIRAEIRNSRDMMVEALYPITGRLVAAAVTNAFRDLIARLNERLEKLTSAGGLKLRARALLRGKSASELALADSHRGRITRILFIERGSGLLIASWQVDGIEADKPELESGLIAAITEFAANALSAQGGELRTVDFGATQVILRSSPRIIVAANCSGPLRPQEQAALDAAFLSLIERHDQGEATDAAALAKVAATLDPAAAAAASRKSGLALALIAGGLAALLLWWVGARFLDMRADANLRARFAAALAADQALSAYPLTLSLAGPTRPVVIGGLTPDRARAEALAESLRADAFPRPVVVSVAAIASAEAMAGQDAALRALAGRQQDEASQAALSRRQGRDDIARLDAAIAAQSRAAASLDDATRAGAAQAAARMDDAGAALARLDGAVRVLDAAMGRLRGEVAAMAPRIDALSGRLEEQAASFGGLASLAKENALKVRQGAQRGELDALAATLPDVEARILEEAGAGLDSHAALDADAGERLKATRDALDGLAGKVAEKERALEALEARLGAGETGSAELGARLQGLDDRLGADGRAEMGARLRALEKLVATLTARPASAAERLQALVARGSFRFARDVVLDDGAGAGAVLDELAGLLRETGAGLRIVGHTDETGTQAANLQVGQRRATLIAQMLAARGVEEGKMTVAVHGAVLAGGDAPLDSLSRFRGVTLELIARTEGQ